MVTLVPSFVRDHCSAVDRHPQVAAESTPPPAASAAAASQAVESADPFFNIAALGATQIDAATCRFLRANRRFTEMIGYSEDQLRQMTFLDVTAPEDVESSRRVFQQHMQGRQSELTLEKRLRRQDGSVFWATVSAAIIRDEDGRALRTAAIVQDITTRRHAEHALRESERGMKLVLETAPVSILSIDCDLRVKFANRVYLQRIGQAADDIVGRSIRDVIGAENFARIAPQVARCLAGEELEFEVELSYRLLGPRHLHVRYNPERDSDGRIRGLVAAIEDITARRASENALRASEERLAAIFAGAAAGLSEISLEGRFLRVNDELCRMLGRRREELIGAAILEVTHPDDIVPTLRAVGEMVHTRERVAVDKRYVHADGHTVWASSMLTRLDDSTGHPRAVLAVTIDLTARHLAERALAESEERLRRAIEIETVGVAFFTLSGRITQANAAFLRMCGYTGIDLQATPLLLDVLSPREYRSHLQRALDELVSLGRTIPYEQEVLREDGTRWWGLVAATRLSTQECVLYAIDITARKENEEELRAYRDELEERVLHRTAELDALNGALRDEIVERKRAEHARQELLAQLVSAQEDERRRISRELHDQVGQDLTGLMLGLKALHRDDGRAPGEELHRLQTLTETIGKRIHDMALEIRPTALDDLGLLRTLSNYVEDWSKRSGIEIEFHSSGWQGERLPSPVETTLYRVVREALNNIVKHSGARRVSLIVERQPEQAVAIVEDDGKGFDLEAAAPARGKRLGLVGMRERAALVGGELSIESTPGQGTTVFVRVPLRSV